jgi:hypothetical protein
MTLGDTLISVWRQSLAEGRQKVDVEDKHYPVGLFRAKKLRNVEFSYGELSIIGIEQNPATNSRWASLARQGNQIMQFRCKSRVWPTSAKANCYRTRRGRPWACRSDPFL